MDALNQARILTSIMTCLDITEDQHKIMSSELSENYRKAMSNLKMFGVYFAEKKSKNRRQAKISKDEFKIFKNSTSSLKYKTLRSTSVLEQIVERCSNNNLEEYPWVSQPITFPTTKKANKMFQKKGLFGEDEDEDIASSDTDPSIILFVIGGISYNEIVALERLQNRLNHKLYMGSTSELSASGFLKSLSEIKTEGDLLFDNDAVGLKSVNLEFK